MKFYMAPMEGMTGYVFRNAYAKYFGDIDRYFTPFISSTGFSHRELNDVLPEHNRGMDVVPQILTNTAEDFLVIAKKLGELGYGMVNLNLGCPSGTVVSKGRGAGFLKEPEALERFLDEIFAKCTLRISVKTRIGVHAATEWERLQEIYNQFPMEELIIHPRVQKDFYKLPVRMEVFRYAVEHSRVPVCYNGDIHSVEDFVRFHAAYPEVEHVMLGRGIFKNPGLAGACREWCRVKGAEGVKGIQDVEDEAGERRGKENGEKKDEAWKQLTIAGQEAWSVPVGIVREMLEELLRNYRQEMGNDLHTLYKMKEIWTYLGQTVPEGARMVKRITKARTIAEYKIAARDALEQMEGGV